MDTEDEFLWKSQDLPEGTQIIAYGLATRVWSYHGISGYGCAECCNGDRCDEDCHAPYKGRRKECPHCKGHGWIPESEAYLLNWILN